jgi:hypothetical protein
MTDTRPMLGPLIERIDRRLTLIEASNRLTYITVDEMTDALLDVRLGCEGADAEDQRRNTRYYAERLLRRLAEPHDA